VNATTGPLTINGQSGLDVVGLGKGGNARTLNGDVTITNQGSFSMVVISDLVDLTVRDVTMGVANGFGFISGMAPAKISFKAADTAGVLVTGGVNGTHFAVADTVNNNHAPLTKIVGGVGPDIFNVQKTLGKLEVQGSIGSDTFNFGGASNT